MKRLASCFLAFLIIYGCSDGVKVLHPQVINPTTSAEIVPLEDSLVVPVLYQSFPNLDSLTLNKAKSKFIAAVLPSILIAKYHLKEQKARLEELKLKQRWSSRDSVFYDSLVTKYKAKNLDQLIFRIHTHPNSIVLAQAAVESGWGSSRFFREANNLFGIWSYREDEPRIAAKNNNVYLRKYENVSQSIEDYFATIGRSKAYHQFRIKRIKTNNVEQLLPLLINYSERGQAYINQLRKIIRQNKLTQYDHYEIDPRYLMEPT